VSKVETETGFVTIGNANLYYEIAGNGQPIVLVHAGVADSRQWNNEFADLSQDYRVLRYDMRGYGKSYPADGEFSHMGGSARFI
jgi:pimeloyl-ACP methyl ester carboxylesterase